MILNAYYVETLLRGYDVIAKFFTDWRSCIHSKGRSYAVLQGASAQHN